MELLDCRNMACPIPVITVKKALKENCTITVLLDDGAPRENVSRYCRNRGHQVSEQQTTDGWSLSILCDKETPNNQPTATGNGRTIFITSDKLGDGPDDLGKLLIKNFIHTLLESRDLPDQIFFANSGVYLTCDGSDVLEALQKLSHMGVELFSCGLCLDFFNLKAHLRAGSTTNMLAVVENLFTADKVIKL